MNTEIKDKNPRGHARAPHACASKPQTILNILIACEESQAECAACRALGHNAFSCDIQPCRKGGNPNWHIKGDVTPLLDGETNFVTMDGLKHNVPEWDLIIAHPPCTYLCKVSSPWLYVNPNTLVWRNGVLLHVNWSRYVQLLAGREFFFRCLQAKARYVAVENPIPMKLANLPSPTCYACPSWYGVKYTKKTLYWLKNLPPLMADYIHPNPKCFVTSSRGKYRSRTFPAMAAAICKQWIDYIMTQTL